MDKTLKTILITGGAGFIGSNLAERLLIEGYKVLCLDNFNNYYNPDIKIKNINNYINIKNFELIKVDIRKKDQLFQILKYKKIGKIIHLAAQPGVNYSFKNPELYMDINVNGLINILDLAVEKRVSNVIFASSSSIYGITQDIPFSEKSRLVPISPYGISKKAGEDICYMYNQLFHLPINILRFFTVYGPRQRPDMAIYKFTRLIDNNKKINIYGNGKTKRDYTFISDIVDGILYVLNKDFNFKIFNLGNSKPITLLYLISLLEKNLNKKARIRFMPERPGDPRITYADIKESKKLLGYKPKISIEEGIKKYIDLYRYEKS